MNLDSMEISDCFPTTNSFSLIENGNMIVNSMLILWSPQIKKKKVSLCKQTISPSQEIVFFIAFWKYASVLHIWAQSSENSN